MSVAAFPKRKRRGFLPAFCELDLSSLYFFSANIPGPVFFTPGIV